MLRKHKYYLEFTKIRPKFILFLTVNESSPPKIPENLTYQAASGDAVPKSVLNATRVIKATQTTKKYERDTIIENQPKWLPAQFEFFRHVSFSPPSMDHQWPIDGPSMGKLFWIQTLPMDGPWVDHAWPCMGVHGISVRVVLKNTDEKP